MTPDSKLAILRNDGSHTRTPAEKQKLDSQHRFVCITHRNVTAVFDQSGTAE